MFISNNGTFEYTNPTLIVGLLLDSQKLDASLETVYPTHTFYIPQKQQQLLAESMPGLVFSHVRNGSRPRTTALLCFRYIYQSLHELDYIQFCLGLFTADLVKSYPLPIPKTMHLPSRLGGTQHCSAIPLGHPIYLCAFPAYGHLYQPHVSLLYEGCSIAIVCLHQCTHQFRT